MLHWFQPAPADGPHPPVHTHSGTWDAGEILPCARHSVRKHMHTLQTQMQRHVCKKACDRARRANAEATGEWASHWHKRMWLRGATRAGAAGITWFFTKRRLRIETLLDNRCSTMQINLSAHTHNTKSRNACAVSTHAGHTGGKKTS